MTSPWSIALLAFDDPPPQPRSSAWTDNATLFGFARAHVSGKHEDRGIFVVYRSPFELERLRSPAFEGPLNRIEADHYTDIPASGRVLEKLGFQHEGILRSYIHKDGAPRNVVR